MTFAKRIQNATPTMEGQTVQICRDAGWLDGKLESTIRNVCSQCDVCARSGMPTPM